MGNKSITPIHPHSTHKDKRVVGISWTFGSEEAKYLSYVVTNFGGQEIKEARRVILLDHPKMVKTKVSILLRKGIMLPPLVEVIAEYLDMVEEAVSGLDMLLVPSGDMSHILFQSHMHLLKVYVGEIDYTRETGIYKFPDLWLTN
jgi:hypothetical protein